MGVPRIDALEERRTAGGRIAPGSWGVIIAFAIFVVVIVYLVASSLSRREIATFEPTADGRSRGLAGGVDTLTVDASNDRQWVHVDLEQGAALPASDTSGWDIAFRRYRVSAADAVADLGVVPFAEVTTAPSDGWVSNAIQGDPVNPAIDRWYRYSMLTHLLEPLGKTYAIRMRDGRFAKLEMLSYYCPGMRPGCVTFRFAAIDPPPLS